MSSWRCTAASTLGRSTVSSRSAVSEETTPSSTTPAACTTPVSGRSPGIAASTAASCCRSAASQAASATSAPAALSSVASSAAPGASGPRRLVSTRLRTPCRATRCLATRAPSAPVAPVTRTVPCGCGSAAAGRGAGRASRGAKARPSRTATWGSPHAGVAARAPGESAWSSRSMSSSRPGFSDWADRTSPQAVAPARSSGPLSPKATAPRVTTARTASANRSSLSHSCTVARTAWVVACVRAARPSPETSRGQKTTSGVRSMAARSA